MLRTLGRIACVVLLAGAVAATLYLLIGSSGHGPREFTAPPAGASFDDHFGPRRGGRWEARSADPRVRRAGHEDASPGRGVGGMLLTALQVAFIAVVVVGVQRRRGRIRCAGR